MSSSAHRKLTLAAAGVIVALTIAAFWLSYAHLQSVAAAHGLAASEARAWAWPATLDLFIIAGELLLLRASLTGRTDWWAIGLTVTGSGGSIALNIAGVGTHAATLDYVVAAVPPTAALLAFGALMRQVHDALAADPMRTPEAPVMAADGPVDAPAAESAAMPAQPATAPADEPAHTTAPDTARPDTDSTAHAPAPAPRPKPRTVAPAPRTRQTPGAGRTARPVRSDEELLEDLRRLRTGADAPLSQRAVLAELGIGVPRLRALLDAHGLTLDPLPTPAPLRLVDEDQDQPERATA